MKKIIIIVILFITNLGFCQYPVLSTSSLASTNARDKLTKKGNYAQDTNNERDQYVGTWQYEENGVTFILKIAKVDQYFEKMVFSGFNTLYFYTDVVVFKYKLVIDNVTLNDNLNESINIQTDSQGYKLANYEFLKGRILDVTRNVIGSVHITKLNTTPEKIKFQLNDGIYTLLNPRSYYKDGKKLFNIPIEEIEMIRIQ